MKVSTRLALTKNFRSFRQNLFELWVFQKMHVLYTIDGKPPISWKIHNSKRLCLKLLKFFVNASLVETFIRANFQVEIKKYDFAGKLGSCRNNLLKILYRAKNKPMGRILVGFLSTLWALPRSKIWGQMECISWWGSLASRCSVFSVFTIINLINTVSEHYWMYCFLEISIYAKKTEIWRMWIKKCSHWNKSKFVFGDWFRYRGALGLCLACRQTLLSLRIITIYIRVIFVISDCRRGSLTNVKGMYDLTALKQ
jgi:hypothetical protein